MGTLAGLVLALSIVVGVANAEGWGYDLGGELMSPYCPGRTISSCPSPQAAELLQWIVTQEAAGATRTEVIEILIERFGEEILGAPKAEGIAIWAYIFPVAGFVVFGGIAALALRRIVVAGEGRPRADASSPAVIAEEAEEAEEATPQAASGEAKVAREAVDDDLARLVDAELASRG